MSDDLHQNLEEYKTQLQQVQAALLGEPDNAELQKLKVDLEEVIELTQDLLGAPSAGPSHASNHSATVTNAQSGDDGELEMSDEEVANILNAVKQNIKAESVVKGIKVGDKCLAFSTTGNAYYEAKVEELRGDMVIVTFTAQNNQEYCKLADLKPVSTMADLDMDAHKKAMNKNKTAMARKMEWQAEREKRKKKREKKQEKLEKMNAVKETEKKKWLDFNTKAKSKSFKGVRKEKSIFASPEGPGGRVGVSGSTGEYKAPQRSHPAQMYGKGMDSLF